MLLSFSFLPPSSGGRVMSKRGRDWADNGWTDYEEAGTGTHAGLCRFDARTIWHMVDQ